MIRAVIYCRCSTEEESQRDALEKQAAEARNCVRRLNWFLEDEYIESRSGTSTKGRMEYNRLFEDLLTDKFDVVVIKSQDRLMRNTKDWYIFIDRLNMGKKQLYLYLENRFYSTDDGLLTGIKAILAEEYSRELSRKINNAHQNRQKTGRSLMVTSNAYGYRKLPDKTMEIVESEAKVKRLMYELCAAGYGSRTIARILQEKGIRKRNGNCFSDSDIRRMIRNPMNKGTIVMNRKHYDFDTRQMQKVPESQQYVYENRVPAIVSGKLWEEANARIDSRIRRKKAPDFAAFAGKKPGKYALSQKLICGLCGAPFYRTVRKTKREKIYEWKCRTYLEQGKEKADQKGGCNAPCIKEKNLWRMLFAVTDEEENPGECKKEAVLVSFCTLVRKTLMESGATEQEFLRESLAKIKRQQKLLLNGYLEGTVPAKLYREKQNVLQKQEISIGQKLTCEENNGVILKRMEEIERFLKKEDVWERAAALWLAKEVEQIRVYPQYIEVDSPLFSCRKEIRYDILKKPDGNRLSEKNKQEEKMEIRQSTKQDLPEILNLYKIAREFMKNHGNPSQWEDKYPEVSTVELDVEQGISYVCTENGKIVGTFVFFIGRDPSYDVIENGDWHRNQLPYGVIHRVASDGQTKGVTKAAFSWGIQQSGYLRIDTHRDNKPMQGALKKFGFRQCGIIHLERGGERIAFDCVKE